MKVPFRYWVLIGITLFVVAVDQWSKYWVLSELTTAFDGATTTGERLKLMMSDAPGRTGEGYHYRLKSTKVISDSFFRLRYAENEGAAFGLFRTLPPAVRGPLFHIVSIGAVVLIGYYLTRLTGHRKEKWALMGLPLILSGAVGNYIDRLARGFVIDFLEAHWFDKAAWPSFNVADTAICIGVGMLLIDGFVRQEKKAG